MLEIVLYMVLAVIHGTIGEPAWSYWFFRNH